MFSWQWNDNIDNEHNVRQDNKLFNSGAPTDNPDASFGSIELPAGKYHYYCTVHGEKNGGGMDGNIEITLFAGKPTPEYVPIEWALDNDNRVGNRWDVQYKVNQGKWKTWKKNTAAFGANFGENDEPVNFSAAKGLQAQGQDKAGVECRPPEQVLTARHLPRELEETS